MATGTLLVVATDVVQAPNDKGQVEPMLEKIEALPEELGKVENLLADTGYFSADNVEACEKAGVEATIVMDVPISRHSTRRFAVPGTQMTIRQRATRWTAVIPSG